MNKLFIAISLIFLLAVPAGGDLMAAPMGPVARDQSEKSAQSGKSGRSSKSGKSSKSEDDEQVALRATADAARLAARQAEEDEDEAEQEVQRVQTEAEQEDEEDEGESERRTRRDQKKADRELRKQLKEARQQALEAKKAERKAKVAEARAEKARKKKEAAKARREERRAARAAEGDGTPEPPDPAVEIATGEAEAAAVEAVEMNRIAQEQAAWATSSYTETIRLIIRSSGDGSGSPLTPGKAKQYGTTVYYNYKFFPGLAVEMPLANVDAMLEDLANVGDFAAIIGAAAAAQTYGTGGSGIGIAVVDSGIANVSDLQSAVRERIDFTMLDAWEHGNPDPFGHGTHVAGILTGSGGSPRGQYQGIAPDAHLFDLRTLDANGRGYTSDAMAAIEWAIQKKDGRDELGRPRNIRIVNLSLGHLPREPAETDPLAMVSRMAVDHGLVVVASAGNVGQVDGMPVYGGITTPGIEPSVITVGAMTTWGTPSRADDTVASYSSRGPTLFAEIIKPDLVAPGTQIVAAKSPGNMLVHTFPQIDVDAWHMWLSGTSMAAPMVSGTVALMLEQNPGLTPNTVKAILMYTAEDTSANPLEEGAGYLNAAGAVNLASNVDATTAVGDYWLFDHGANLDYSNVISGYPAVWSKTIVWGKSLYQIDNFDYNETSYSETIVWGKTIAWDEIDADTIVWGKTIAWDDF